VLLVTGGEQPLRQWPWIFTALDLERGDDRGLAAFGWVGQRGPRSRAGGGLVAAVLGLLRR